MWFSHVRLEYEPVCCFWVLPRTVWQIFNMSDSVADIVALEEQESSSEELILPRPKKKPRVASYLSISEDSVTFRAAIYIFFRITLKC